MVITWFLSVVIDIIYVRRAIIKTENHPPVGPDRHSPKTFHLAFERMQPKPRLIQVGNGWGGMKGRQNIPLFLGIFGVYTAWIVPFKQPFQSLVADCFYHLEP